MADSDPNSNKGRKPGGPAASLTLDGAVQWLQSAYQGFVGTNPVDKGMDAFKNWINTTQPEDIKRFFRNANDKIIKNGRQLLDVVGDTAKKKGAGGLWDLIKGQFGNTGGVIGSLAGGLGGFWLGNAIGDAIGGPIVGFLLGLMTAVIGLVLGGGIGGGISNALSGGDKKITPDRMAVLGQDKKPLREIPLALDGDNKPTASKEAIKTAVRLELIDSEKGIYKITHIAIKTNGKFVEADVRNSNITIGAENGAIDLSNPAVQNAIRKARQAAGDNTAMFGTLDHLEGARQVSGVIRNTEKLKKELQSLGNKGNAKALLEKLSEGAMASHHVLLEKQDGTYAVLSGTPSPDGKKFEVSYSMELNSLRAVSYHPVLLREGKLAETTAWRKPPIERTQLDNSHLETKKDGTKEEKTADARMKKAQEQAVDLSYEPSLDRQTLGQRTGKSDNISQILS